MTFSVQDRKLIMDYILSNHCSEAAIDVVTSSTQIIRVSRATVYDWIKLWKETGSYDPIRYRTPCAPLICNVHLQFIIDLLEEFPAMQTSIIIQQVAMIFHVTYTEHQVRNALYANKFSSHKLQAEPLERDHAARAEWLHLIRPVSQGGLFDARHFVFADETHLNPEELYARYGRAVSNNPAVQKRHFNHRLGNGCSSIAAMSLKGIIAVKVLGINDADSFLTFLEFYLLPVMNPYPEPESVLGIDNARVHDKLRIIALCQRFGVICLFLPTYSFDFNPIELCFNDAKGWLRQKHSVAVSEDPLTWQLETALWNSVTTEQACSTFRHCFIEVTEDAEDWAKES
jgi:transposase